MKKIVCIMVMLLSVMMTFAGGILYDVSFERRIDMLNLEGESYDSVLVKFDVGDVLEDYVKVTIWNKKGKADLSPHLPEDELRQGNRRRL